MIKCLSLYLARRTDLAKTSECLRLEHASGQTILMAEKWFLQKLVYVFLIYQANLKKFSYKNADPCWESQNMSVYVIVASE